ncbi:MAG: hypothetical protein ACRENN_01465, partial [Candidatus Eiseniibacteriota bacterium]
LGLGGLDAFFDLGAAISGRDAKRALETLDRLYDGGLDVEEIADGLTHHLRQLLLLAVDPGLATLIEAAPSDRERYAAQATTLRANDLTAMLSILLESRGQLRRAEAPRVLLEVCLVELCSLPRASEVGELIQRLEALEKRLGGSGTSDPGRGSAPSRGPEPPRSAAPPRSSEPLRSAAPPRSSEPLRSAAPPRAQESHRPPSLEPPPRPAASAPPRAERAETIAVAESPAAEESPAAAESPATAIEPASEGDAVVRWRQAVDRVKDRKLLLGTCLEEGLFLGIAGSNVRVALSPEHAFHRAMLEMKENREILNQEFEKLYGRGTSLLCVSTDQAVTGVGYSARVPSPAELEEEEPPQTSDQLVQRIVDLFDGEILNPGPQGSGAS